MLARRRHGIGAEDGMKSCLTALAVLGVGFAFPAIAAGDPSAGRTLADAWCASRHTVTKEGLGRDSAPSFSSIARSRADQGWVRAWLTDPHPPMVNLNLSRRQIDDIVAYLDSLRGR
jgi:mono/diheme cytochrome c family protein